MSLINYLKDCSWDFFMYFMFYINYLKKLKKNSVVYFTNSPKFILLVDKKTNKQYKPFSCYYSKVSDELI